MQPIHKAAMVGHAEIVTILVEKYGIDPQEKADVCLYVCSHNNYGDSCVQHTGT